MKPAFQIKQIVWYKGNRDLHGYVKGIYQTIGEIKYTVGWNDGTEGQHYDFEITPEKPLDY